MADMSFGRVALLASIAGSCLAIGVMAAVAARAAYAITRGGRWYQIKQL